MPESMTHDQIIQAFLTCDSDAQNGGNCFEAFDPTFNVTLPSLDSGGLPEFEVELPDFSGITIEGIIDAIKMIGLDPCALMGPVADAAAAMVGQLEFALNQSLQNLADLPATIENEMNTVAQENINELFAPATGILGTLRDPCAGLVGAAQEAFDADAAMQGQIDGLSSDLSSLQNQVDNLPTPTP